MSRLLQKNTRWSAALLPAGCRFIGCLGFLMLLSGCGDSYSERGLVSGTVTINGKPAPSGRITFYPVDGERPATAQIFDGKYKLSSFGAEDGALLGEHVVAIKCVDASPKSPPKPLAEGASIMEEEKYEQALANSMQVKYLVPEVFSIRKTSPLKRTVVEGENVIDFETKEMLKEAKQ